MTHKLILKVKKFQLCSAKSFGTVQENLHGMDLPPPPPPPPIPFRVKLTECRNVNCFQRIFELELKRLSRFHIKIRRQVNCVQPSLWRAAWKPKGHWFDSHLSHWIFQFIGKISVGNEQFPEDSSSWNQNRLANSSGEYILITSVLCAHERLHSCIASTCSVAHLISRQETQGHGNVYLKLLHLVDLD